jgi:DNA-repair protein XRCC2
LNWGDVLEIQGPSGSGKSQLLYILLATCIIPSSHGGWGKAAVLFDTEGAFDPRKFNDMLLFRVLSRFNASFDDAQLFAAKALHNLHVFRPASSVQLAASVYNLPAYQRAHMPDADIALVAVDSLSAFYWPDRFTAEQLRPLGLPHSSTPLYHVLTALQSLRISHNPVTVLTNWALSLADNSNGPSGTPIFYKQHLPSFPSFPDSAASLSHGVPSLPLTHHITLYLAPFPPFHRDTSLPDPKEASRVTGHIRRPGNSQVVRFEVDIRTNDVI